jgi:hypothetical protein
LRLTFFEATVRGLLRGILAAAVLAITVSCGGKFEGASGGTGGQGGSSASSGTGGASGSGGSGGSGAVSGGGGGGFGGAAGVAGSGGECASGHPCGPEGNTCVDSDCCPCMYECQRGVWQMTACAGCAPPSCPPEPPVNGDWCGGCSSAVGVSCGYDQCPAGSTVATCDGQYWEVFVEPCGSSCCTSDGGCGGNQLCVSSVCKEIGSGCWRNDQCAAGELCVGASVCPCGSDCDGPDYMGTCLPQGFGCCGIDYNCGSDQECVSGVCKALPPVGSCWSTRNCGGNACVGGQVCPCGAACLLPDQLGYCG